MLRFLPIILARRRPHAFTQFAQVKNICRKRKVCQRNPVRNAMWFRTKLSSATPARRAPSRGGGRGADTSTIGASRDEYLLIYYCGHHYPRPGLLRRQHYHSIARTPERKPGKTARHRLRRCILRAMHTAAILISRVIWNQGSRIVWRILWKKGVTFYLRNSSIPSTGKTVDTPKKASASASASQTFCFPVSVTTTDTWYLSHHRKVLYSMTVNVTEHRDVKLRTGVKRHDQRKSHRVELSVYMLQLQQYSLSKILMAQWVSTWYRKTAILRIRVLIPSVLVVIDMENPPPPAA